jgi:hypothetical protein
MSKWADILRDSRKFQKFLMIAKNAPKKSGETRSLLDEMDQACTFFFQAYGRNFEFPSCYNILKDTPLLSSGLGKKNVTPISSEQGCQAIVTWSGSHHHIWNLISTEMATIVRRSLLLQGMLHRRHHQHKQQ